MNPYLSAVITVTVALPSGKRVSSCFNVPLEQARVLEPLPKNHDSPFEWEAGQRANTQIRERHHLIELLSKELSKHLADSLHELDPYNGYDRSELRGP